MKKIVLFINICILFLIKCPYVNASELNKFEWNRLEIDIPLNSNFESYLDCFDVSFYYNGKLTDEEVIVKLDPIYYSSLTIDTSKPCNKEVSLIAYVNGYTNYDRRQVIVHIKDTDKPVINLIKELVLNVNEEFEPTKYFDFYDNDSINSSTISFDYNISETKIIGKHNIKVSCSDVSGNHTIREFYYQVVDKTTPYINVSSVIEVNYGDINFDIRKFVKAIDDLDGDITNSIKIDNIDVYKLGEQSVKIIATDSSNNSTEIIKKIKIIDGQAPSLELSKYRDIIDVNEVYDIDFSSYILHVSDNVTKLSKENVVIDKKDFTSNIGESPVYYYVYDEEGNYIKRTLLVDIVSKEAPIIEASDLTFKLNESFDLKDYITVTSSFDTNVSKTFIVDEKMLNRSKAGKYEVIIEAYDIAGNESVKSIFVTIEEDNINSPTNYFKRIYDFIYKNKMIIIVAVGCITCFIVYQVKKKKNKLGL